ncbi:MAG: transporter substrate-binding domain-containing protein [Christensenellales bacterium]
MIKKLRWDGLVPALDAGTIDVIIAGMSPTEERKTIN